jgi:large subunit ribosomal protein L17
MRHRMDRKRFSRTTSHRRAMFRNMAAALFQHGAIRTTEPKAKRLRRFAEKVITLAKTDTLHARRRVMAELNDRDLVDNDGEFEDKTLVQKLFDDIAPRYANRSGGYTRIIKLAERRLGDAGRQVILQLVEEDAAAGSGSGGSSRRKSRAAKLYAAAAAVAPAAVVEEAPAEDVEEDVVDAPAEEAVADEAAPAEEEKTDE